MRYLIRQKYFAIKDRYTIFDDANQPCFQVEGRLFSFGKKLTIFDLQGNEIYFLKQRFINPFGRFDIFKGEERVGTLKGRLSFFVKRYKAEGVWGSLKVRGGVFGFNWKIFNKENKALVASLSKKILQIADTYVIDVVDDNYDQAILVAIGILIDAIHHKRR